MNVEEMKEELKKHEEMYKKTIKHKEDIEKSLNRILGIIIFLKEKINSS